LFTRSGFSTGTGMPDCLSHSHAKTSEKNGHLAERVSESSVSRRVVYSCSMASPHDVTRLLREWANGAQSALEALTPLVYAELRRLAASYLRSEQPGHTLQPTALVHEAFIRLIDRSTPDCQNRSQFYGVAAHLMRQILIDHARTRQAVKRGGHVVRLSLEEDLVVSHERDTDLLALDDALERLAAIDPRRSRMVELRFFGGLSVEETAEVLKVSEKTVRRDWQFTKTWLLRELSGEKRDGR
jgi:RNA polymerase sigma-70 factor (ECF subfamily)